MAPSISIVVRTHNCADVLRLTLSTLRLAPGDELIAVDSESTDTSVHVAKEFGARIVVIRQQDFTYGKSLNVGFEAAINPWILALSSHCVPVREDFLDQYRRAISRFGPDTVAAVGPIVLSAKDQSGSGITFYSRADFRHGFGFASGNPNALYRSDAWAEHPFDERLAGAEECEWFVWALKRGYELAAVHAAAVRYDSRRPLKSFYKKGGIDYRWQREYLDVAPPRAGKLAWYFLKQCALAALGRLPAGLPIRSAVHALGQIKEYRRLKKTNSIPTPAILVD